MTTVKAIKVIGYVLAVAFLIGIMVLVVLVSGGGLG